MPKKVESIDEIARRYEAMIDDESQDASFKPVQAYVKPRADVVYSTRYSEEEIALIRRAAKEREMAPTAFIRAAALAAAAGELDLTRAESVAALQDARTKALHLVEALERL